MIPTMTNKACANIATHYQSQKSEFSDPFRLRVHRSLSWLTKAGSVHDDDIRFITLWIAFNTSYTHEVNLFASSSERSEFRRFLQSICCLDTEQKIYTILWETYSGRIRVLLDNKYTSQPFWDSQISQQAWKEYFKRVKDKVHRALNDKDTDRVLAVVFNRLYTLRNQIMHGGTTHNSQVNHAQIKDGGAIFLLYYP